MVKLNKGVLYIATGEKYVAEAIQSAISCREHNSYPIALITDSAAHVLPEALFDIVIIQRANFNYKDKLLIRHSPFEQTVFLDTDTYVADKLDDLFKILDYREFAIHQADEGYEYQMPDVSNAMPEFNTGVIAYKLTSAVKNLIDAWEISFNTNPQVVTDQYHLRKTLYDSDVKFAVFSSAYNFIIYYPNFVIQTVKILHGRPFSALKKVANDVNAIRHDNAWRRTYFPYNHDFALIYANMLNRDIIKLVKFNTRAFFANYYRGINKKLFNKKH
ncbi:hypothetical protein [Mucilaginibacter sp.]|uniref:hypothetical protein n=1 Tax=Mucilaginibacter sp. TaxID=1882438 RepID=UPI0026025AC7|nr:hypothetical protein [Mucilaginibacter sp.]MDB4927018.1 hypothetical protein [Mucilaginibacter sp.]